MSKRKPARAQAIRCSDEALERLRVGETVLAVYEDLIERGEIDMAYRTFADWMKRFGEDPETLPKIAKSKNAIRSGFAAERSSVVNSRARSNKTPRKPGEPFIGSIGIAPDAWKPSAEPPNLKKLMGEE